MKLLISGLLLAFSTVSFAYETQIITSTTSGNVTLGFSDSSFDYSASDTEHKKNFCYFGNVNNVCSLVYKAALQMGMDASNGAHDSMEVLSCVVDNESIDDYHVDEYASYVVTQYKLSDDYGSEFVVKRTIHPCSEARSL